MKKLRIFLIAGVVIVFGTGPALSDEFKSVQFVWRVWTGSTYQATPVLESMMPIETFSAESAQRWALDLAWSLWTELGVSGQRRSHSNVGVDLEPIAAEVSERYKERRARVDDRDQQQGYHGRRPALRGEARARR